VGIGRSAGTFGLQREAFGEHHIHGASGIDLDDRLSQYYITLAEKMFPIIEVDAGRTVDVVFTKGFSLETEGTSGTPDTYTDIWRRGREVQKKPLEP
ncbi:MAG: hypothetical protein KJ702_16625, partial [Gammaproteobacteria bacterium]|nr:hypothetical protein [Gammaproteobacteria bacterium]